MGRAIILDQRFEIDAFNRQRLKAHEKCRRARFGMVLRIFDKRILDDRMDRSSLQPGEAMRQFPRAGGSNGKLRRCRQGKMGA